MTDESKPADKLTEAKLAELTAQIVSAYVAHNALPAAELPGFIRNVTGSFQRDADAVPEPAEIVPAVSIRKSIAPDHLVCLVCGRRQKTLKRHLSTAHGLAPADYRQRFGLSPEYPMVASAYSEARSAMAKEIGLGRKGRMARGAGSQGSGGASSSGSGNGRRGRPRKNAEAE